jgi:hypothetical protein
MLIHVRLRPRTLDWFSQQVKRHLKRSLDR